ncbi:hypothetical protein Mterra_03888 [Calidithermus terrae]|uniref:Uncharacterized protein n=1 Tax=Calidithermus terrae TaxID=1408545 RepID=A0A399E1F3_9DEIN|nr:hypothetical protein Mterra_03888 [Calidithermus terrae]
MADHVGHRLAQRHADHGLLGGGEGEGLGVVLEADPGGAQGQPGPGELALQAPRLVALHRLAHLGGGLAADPLDLAHLAGGSSRVALGELGGELGLEGDDREGVAQQVVQVAGDALALGDGRQALVLLGGLHQLALVTFALEGRGVEQADEGGEEHRREEVGAALRPGGAQEQGKGEGPERGQQREQPHHPAGLRHRLQPGHRRGGVDPVDPRAPVERRDRHPQPEDGPGVGQQAPVPALPAAQVQREERRHREQGDQDAGQPETGVEDRLGQQAHQVHQVAVLGPAVLLRGGGQAGDGGSGLGHRVHCRAVAGSALWATRAKEWICPRATRGCHP